MRLIPALILLFLGCLQAGAPGNGVTTCPASGNKILNATNTTALSWIQFVAGTPGTANTGQVSIGSSSITSGTGGWIGPGGTWLWPPMSNIQPYRLSQIYIACTVPGDVITYTYFQ